MKKCRLVWMTGCIVIMTMVMMAREARGQEFGFNPLAAVKGAAAPVLVDMAKVTDPKAKAAVEAISRLQAPIREIKVGEVKETLTGAKSALVFNGQILMRWPNAIYYQKTATMPGTAMDGYQCWQNSDGKICWSITKKSPQSLAMQVQKMKAKNMPEDQIQRMSAEWTKLYVTKMDLGRARQAGLPDTFMAGINSINIIRPLMLIDPTTLKLTEETPENWTFTAEVSKEVDTGTNKITQTLIFSKKDGLPRKIMTPPQATIELDKVEVNPAPPIPAQYFGYTPQAGIAVNDTTADTIKMFKEMRQKANP